MIGMRVVGFGLRNEWKETIKINAYDLLTERGDKF